MAGNQVRFKAQLDDQVSGKLGKIRDQFDRLGKSKGAATILQGVGMGAGISAFNLLGNAVGMVTNALADGVRGAIAEEASIRRMTAALQANIPAWDGNTDAIEAAATAAMDLGFADDDVRDSMTKLVPATRDVNEALRVQKVAMDLARLKGISLVEASEALVKVEAGQYRALKSLGIVLKDGATATEAMAEVQRVAAGQTGAYMDTLAGKAEAAKVKLDNFWEGVGASAVKGAEDVGTALDFIGYVLTHLEPNQDMEQTFYDWEAAGRAASVQIADVGGKLEYVANRAERARSRLVTVDDAQPGWREMRDLAKDAAKYLRGVKDAANDARDALFGASKGPKETRLSLEGARLEGKDLADQLDELQKKKPTRDVRQDIIDTKLAIIDNKKEVIRLEGELVTLGKVNLSKHKDTIKDLGFGWGTATDELADYLRLLSQLPGVKIPKPTGRFAAKYNDPDLIKGDGGPVYPGNVYTVGDKGPERLVMSPMGGGYVIPNQGGGAAVGGGAPVVVQLNLDGREIARVVDRHLYYEAARAPLSPYAG